MGEGIGNDEAIMPYITSANISCGFHAGNGDTIRESIALALRHNVRIGAHPSFRDKENFGRKEMHLDPDKLYAIVLEQLIKMDLIAKEKGAKLYHVKPHGALYNIAAKDAGIAGTIALAIKDFNEDLVLYGLSNSCLISEGKALGLQTANEVFADRTYQKDGSLTPRSHNNALIEDEEQCLQQVMQMITKGTVTTTSGKIIPIAADTICIHGDGKYAVSFAKKIFEALKQPSPETI
ncbi:MAG: LamB/YcsF family protein [Flavisolibacter sp.]|nr:LamB/YcsF family protein [Flavisolibacter sp.]